MKIIFTLFTFIVVFNFSSKAQCNASFTYSINNDTVKFKAQDSSKSLTHYWDFGDGNFLTSTQKEVSIKYNPGTFIVKHIVADSVSSCRDSVTQIIIVNYTLNCKASFISSHGFLLNNEYIFYSNSTFNGTGFISNYLWKVDGIQVSNNSFLNDTLPVGKHQVCLSIVTSLGCSSSICDTIEVSRPVRCNSNTLFNTVASSLNSKQIHFTATPATQGLSYQWSFGDGIISNEPAITHIYNDTGRYTARLYVYDSLIRNCIDTIHQNVVVKLSAADSCTASFIYTSQSNQLSFTAISNQSITTASWVIYKLNNLRDSTVYFTSNQINPVYKLSDTGNYYVCVKLITNSNCNSTYCDTIYVSSISTNRQINFIPSYPNPAINEVKLSIDINTASSIIYTVYDNTGLPVYQKQQQGLKGTNTITIPLQQLKKGQYFIDIQYGNKRKRSVFQKL